MTIDRIIHLTVGIVFFIIFLKLSKSPINTRLIIGFIAMAIGTWMPDWDLLLGIGFHRSPITHSALPALLVGWLVYKSKLQPILIIGFCLGLSSHLAWDIVAYGNVQWISGGNNDRLFLFINALILIIVAIVINKKPLTNHST
ncbi:MAG: hypothetical protein HFP77_00115 [Methylococcales symbiont of Iophon sp. n. MRB-2018]|nr:MAG: hypothetical protein HFP77_00115 [Methylococcales symbiont of Iophon sp. n. MRB-2018]KAF3980800.1 MAG: hypothetical protein HFP76_00215 [Methylococcales symbiont of Iophon sp. n. MRB-2018]